MFVAAGNDSSTDYVELARCDAVTTVGAYYIQNNKAIPEDFSSTTEYLDFVAPDRQVVKFAKETGVTTYGNRPERLSRLHGFAVWRAWSMTFLSTKQESR